MDEEGVLQMPSAKLTRLPSGNVAMSPELAPVHDPHLRELYEQATAGTLPVYYAVIPLVLCIPFDIDYRPDLHRVGRMAIDQSKNEWKLGSYQYLYVYQRGAWFVVADDYIPLFAALEGNPDCVPCWVFGCPDSPLVQEIQGPLDRDKVRKILGLP